MSLSSKGFNAKEVTQLVHSRVIYNICLILVEKIEFNFKKTIFVSLVVNETIKKPL